MGTLAYTVGDRIAFKSSPDVSLAAHEATHVRTLKKVLGSAAVMKPKFDFGDTVTNQDKFKMTSQVLEDTGVAAYAGQGGTGTSSLPAPKAFDKALSEKKVLSAVKKTGFIQG